MEAHNDIGWLTRNLPSLWISILINELFNVKITSTNTYNNLVPFFNFHVHTTLTKLVNSFWFAQKEYFQILSFRILIQILFKLHVQLVLLMTNINSMALFQHFKLSIWSVQFMLRIHKLLFSIKKLLFKFFYNFLMHKCLLLEFFYLI